MLVMVLNLLEQCSFQDLLFHLLFLPKSAENSASRMDIIPYSLVHKIRLHGRRGKKNGWILLTRKIKASTAEGSRRNPV